MTGWRSTHHPQGFRKRPMVLDTHKDIEAFVKNAGLGFAIPCFHNGQPHDDVPDCIIRFKSEPPVHLILETKGYDPLEEVKAQAARRWVDTVHVDGRYGRWYYAVARAPDEVKKRIEEIVTL